MTQLSFNFLHNVATATVSDDSEAHYVLEQSLRLSACVCVCVQEGSEYMQYLRQSQHEILKEEERRYRFLAEKHCGLTQSLLYLINKVQLLSIGVH